MIKFRRPIQTNSLVNVLDDIFSDFVTGTEITHSNPSVNILESDQAFTIEMALPGINKSEVDIKVEKDQLIVSSSHTETTDESNDKGTYRKRGFNFKSFRKSFHLPDAVDSNNIQANYDKGILAITLNKKEEAKEKEPRSIEIK